MAGRRYVMTARRKAALRKAQLSSARKRRKGRGRKAAIVGVLGIAAAGYGTSSHAYKRGWAYKHRKNYKTYTNALSMAHELGSIHGPGKYAFVEYATNYRGARASMRRNAQQERAYRKRMKPVKKRARSVARHRRRSRKK